MTDPFNRQLRESVPIFHDRPNQSIVGTLEKFRAYAIYEGWSEETKCQKIIGFLGGRAQKRFLDDDARFPPHVKSDWRALKATLVQVFTPVGSNRLWASAFTNRAQEPGEPAAVFLDSLLELAEKGFPTFDRADREELVRCHFLAKLRDPLCSYLNSTHVTSSLHELEIAATNYEMGPKMARGLQHRTDHRDFDKQHVFMGLAVQGDSAIDQAAQAVNHLHVSNSDQGHRRGAQRSFRGARGSTRSRNSHYQNQYARGQHTSNGRSYNYPAPTQHQWTTDGKPICAECGKIGHIGRECRSRAPTNRGFQGNNRSFNVPRGPRGAMRSRGYNRGYPGRQPVRMLNTGTKEQEFYYEYPEETEEYNAEEMSHPVWEEELQGGEEIALLTEQNRRLQDRLRNIYILQVHSDQLEEDVGHTGQPQDEMPTMEKTPTVFQVPTKQDLGEGLPTGQTQDEMPTLEKVPIVSQVPTKQDSGEGLPAGQIGEGLPTGQDSGEGLPTGQDSGKGLPAERRGEENYLGEGPPSEQGFSWNWRFMPTVSLSQIFVYLGIIILLLCLGSVDTTHLNGGLQKQDLHFCDGSSAVQIWRNGVFQPPLHEAPTMGSGEGIMATITLQFYKLRLARTLNVTLCQCSQQTLTATRGPLATRHISLYSQEPVQLKELDCHRMENWKRLHRAN